MVKKTGSIRDESKIYRVPGPGPWIGGEDLVFEKRGADLIPVRDTRQGISTGRLVFMTLYKAVFGRNKKEA